MSKHSDPAKFEFVQMKYPGNILLKTGRNIRIINDTLDASMKDINNLMDIPETISLKNLRNTNKMVYYDPVLLFELLEIGKVGFVEYVIHTMVI